MTWVKVISKVISKVKVWVKVMSKVTVVVKVNVHLASPEDSPEGAGGAVCASGFAR